MNENDDWWDELSIKKRNPSKDVLMTLWGIFALLSIYSAYNTYSLSSSWNNIGGLDAFTFTLYDIVPFVSITHLVCGVMSIIIAFYYYKNIGYIPRLLSLFLWIIFGLSILREQTLLTHEYWISYKYGENYRYISYVFYASIPALAIALYSIKKIIPFIVIPICGFLILWFEPNLITFWQFNIILGFFTCLILNKNLWIYAIVASLLSVDWGINKIDKFLLDCILEGNFRPLIKLFLSLKLFLLGLLIISHLHNSVSLKRLQAVRFSVYERVGFAILMLIVIMLNHY